MLFGEEVSPWMSFLLGSGLVGVLGLVGGGVAWLLRWRRDGRKESEDREDREEETALHRLQAVMELREADCNRRINDLTQRVGALEAIRDAKQAERDALRDSLAMYAARVKVLTVLLRQAGVRAEEWDKPDTVPGGLPAVDTTPREGH